MTNARCAYSTRVISRGGGSVAVLAFGATTTNGVGSATILSCGTSTTGGEGSVAELAFGTTSGAFPKTGELSELGRYPISIY